MINAKEALKITNDSIMTYVNKIEEGIKAAAALGKHRYEHLFDADGDIVEEVKHIVQQAGYKAKTESSFGFDCQWRTNMIITWENKKSNAENS